MFEPYPFGLAGRQRSDRHGVIERHPALALSRPFLDPGDIAARWVARPPRPKRATMSNARSPPWRRDANKTASGKPGAVQTARPPMITGSGPKRQTA